MKPSVNQNLSLCLVVAGVLISQLPVRAVDFHVATSQDLQNALTLAAANGADDVIYLTNGYYVGNFNFSSSEARNLALLPEAGLSSTNITLDGAGGGRALSISSSASANTITVRGIAFLRNCGDSAKGALRIAAGSNADIMVNGCRFISPTNSSGMGLEVTSGLNATISGCTVLGSTSGGGGTGISISTVTGNISVQNCVISTNNSGGVSVTGGNAIGITNNVFAGNGGVYDGGGAYFNTSGTVTMSGNTFTGNSAGSTYSGRGGGAYLECGTVTVSGNTFTGNSVSGWDQGSGGGAYFNSGTVTISGNTFTGNSASGASGGGGAYFNSGTVTMSGNTFTDNSASSRYNGGGGGAYFNRGTATISGNTFTGNSSTPSGGGVLLGADTALLVANIFKLNTATQNGGAAYASGTTITVSDNLVTKNSQSGLSYTGGGIWVNASSSLFLINNTITANTAAGGGGGLACQVSGVVELLNVYNNIIWGNTAGGNGADVNLSGTGKLKQFMFNDAHDKYGVWDIAPPENNPDVDPRFYDPVNGDYHLRNGSPCINAGTNGAPSLPDTDLDGNPRILLSVVDMGCYEFSNTGPHPADVNGDWVITDAEYTAYAAAWKNNQPWSISPTVIPADYVTRAGYLKANGGHYHNDGSAKPTCWKPGAP